MKKLAILLIAGLIGSFQNLYAAKSGDLIGHISALKNFRSLPFVSLALIGADSKALGHTESDQNGNFTLSDIPAGVYELAVFGMGYIPEKFRVEIRANDVVVAPIVLMESEHMIYCVAELPLIERGYGTRCFFKRSCPTICVETVYLVEDQPTEVQNSLPANNLNEDGFALFPNPSSGKLNLASAKGISATVIRDISGRTVFETSSPEHQIFQTHDLSSLPPGTYIVSFMQDNKYFREKWVLAH